MILDNSLVFSDSQAVTGTAGAINATNDIDLGAAGDANNELFLVIQVDVTGDSASDDGTVVFALKTDDNSAFGSATTLWTSAAHTCVNCVAGTTLYKIRLPRGLERYLRLVYTTAVHDWTAGKFSAFLTRDVQTNNG